MQSFGLLGLFLGPVIMAALVNDPQFNIAQFALSPCGFPLLLSGNSRSRSGVRRCFRHPMRIAAASLAAATSDAGG
jgi:hypothetical protein